jgi:hypothetical protein
LTFCHFEQLTEYFYIVLIGDNIHDINCHDI